MHTDFELLREAAERLVEEAILSAGASRDIRLCKRAMELRDILRSYSPPAMQHKLIQMVLDDMDVCYGEIGLSYQFQDLSEETVTALNVYRNVELSKSSRGLKP